MTNKGSVYVLDDNDGVLRTAADLLRVSGRTTVCLASAVDFLAACNARHPGCLVADLTMPGIDGRKFLSRVRTLHNRLSIVLVAAGLTEDDERAWMNLGVTLILPIPFGPLDLFDAVDLALARSQSQFEP